MVYSPARVNWVRELPSCIKPKLVAMKMMCLYNIGGQPWEVHPMSKNMVPLV
jgi:hypothetical protein